MTSPYREERLEMLTVRKVIPWWLGGLLAFLGLGVGWGVGHSKAGIDPSSTAPCRDSVREYLGTSPHDRDGCGISMIDLRCESPEHVLRVEVVGGYRRVICTCPGHGVAVAPEPMTSSSAAIPHGLLP